MVQFVNQPNGSAVTIWEQEVMHQLQAMGGMVKPYINFRMLNNAEKKVFRSMEELEMYPRAPRGDPRGKGGYTMGQGGFATEIPVQDTIFGYTEITAEEWATRLFTDIFRMDEVNFEEIPHLADELTKTVMRQMDKICLDAIYDATTRFTSTNVNPTDKEIDDPNAPAWVRNYTLGDPGNPLTKAQVMGGIPADTDGIGPITSNKTRSGYYAWGKNTVPLHWRGKNFHGGSTAEKGWGSLLSYEKLLRLKLLCDNQNCSSEMSRMIFCTPNQLEQLLYTTEVQSADYNTVRALVRGEIDTFCGFKFMTLEPRKEGALRHRNVNNVDIGTTGSGVTEDGITDALCWIPKAVGGIMKNEFTHSIDWVPERIAHQMVAWFKMGVQVTDHRGIFMIPTRTRFERFATPT